MPSFEIRRFQEISDPQRLLSAIDDIFFAASSVSSFADEAARAAFRERWLGRFLRHDPEWVYVAGRHLDDAGAAQVLGYLVASLDDPARTERFSDIGYFEDFATVTPRYPAQVHINLDASVRGGGLGSRLLQTALGDLAAAGVAGVHVVTGRGMRNVGFYTQNGFEPVATAQNQGKDIVLLGRSLRP